MKNIYCPHCLAEVAVMEGITGPGEDYYQVECPDCLSAGPRALGTDQAAQDRAERAWDRLVSGGLYVGIRGQSRPPPPMTESED